MKKLFANAPKPGKLSNPCKKISKKKLLAQHTKSLKVGGAHPPKSPI